MSELGSVSNMSHSEAAAFSLSRSRQAINSLVVPGRSEAPVVAPTLPSAALGLLVALGYYAGSQIGFFLTPTGTPISTFWPPNAILLAAFLLTSPRTWWVLVLAVLPAHLLVQLRTGIPLISALVWFVGNTGEALLGAVCVRIFKKDKPLFESANGVIVFLAFGVLLPIIATSFLDAAGVVLTGLGQNYWMLWTTRLTSNIVADLTIVPAIVIFGVKGLSWFRRASIWAYAEAAVLTMGTVAVSLLAFGRETAPIGFWTFIYVLLPFLIWALLRFGSGAVSALTVVVALICFWNSVQGRGSLGMQSTVYAVLSLHFLVTALAVSFMLSGALIAERRRNEETLRSTRDNLVYAQERDRCRIARELHDNILQRLTLIGLHMDELRAASLVFSKSPFNSLYDQITDVSNRIRDLSHDLHPFMLEYLGLPRALKKLCRDTGAQFGITIDFSEHDLGSPLPSDVSGCLFRVAQEALQDIAQYSHAKAALMELRLSGGAVLMRISYDGGGSVWSEGAELTLVGEQLLALNGHLDITSMASKGTVVEVSIPLKDTPEPRLSLD